FITKCESKPGNLRHSAEEAPMPGHGDKLTRKQEVSIAALLTEPTITAAAQTAGISEKTLRTWLKKPEFSRAFREWRRQLVETAVARVQQLTTEAVDALRELLRGRNETVRLGAAKAVLDYAREGIQSADVLQRLEDLEQLLLKRDAPHGPDRHT